MKTYEYVIYMNSLMHDIGDIVGHTQIHVFDYDLSLM